MRLLFVGIFTCSTLKATQVYTVALLDKPPWAQINDQGEVVGLYRDYLQHIASQSHGEFSFNFRVYPIARILHEMKTAKDIDFTFMSLTRERAEYLYPLQTVFSTDFGIVSRKDHPIMKISDLKNKVVASLLGESNSPCIPEELHVINRKLKLHSQGLNMLLKGRVDAVSAPLFRLNMIINQLGIEEKLAPMLAYEKREVVFATSAQVIENRQLEWLTHMLLRPANKRYFRSLLASYFEKDILKHIEVVSENAQSNIVAQRLKRQCIDGDFPLNP